jgi:hypothetical protein
MRHGVILLLALAAAGCETAPSVPSRPASIPVAAANQIITQDGEIRSVRDHYAVLVKKLDHGDPSLSDLAAHGLPITVVFANLSSAPVDFGPDHISVTGDARYVVLTADDIEKIKQAEQESNNSDSLFGAMLAVVGTVQAGQLMQSGALSQGQATALSQGLATMAVTNFEDDQAQNTKIDQESAAALEHYNSIVLQSTTVNPHQKVGGVVFIRHATADAALTLGVQTGATLHSFNFVAPETLQTGVTVAQTASPEPATQAGAQRK